MFGETEVAVRVDPLAERVPAQIGPQIVRTNALELAVEDLPPEIEVGQTFRDWLKSACEFSLDFPVIQLAAPSRKRRHSP